MRQLALLLLVVASCKKSDSTSAATGSAGSSAQTGSAAAATTVDAAPAAPADAAVAKEKASCEKVIPQAVADKYFKGLATKHMEPTGDYGDGFTMMTCRFIIDEKANTRVLVEYNCGGQWGDLESYLAQQQQIFKKTKIKRVKDIGRGGYQMGSTYGVAHRSRPCVITVDLAYLDDNDPWRKKDYFGLLRELEAAWPDAP
jgi:hypothetical protein